MNKMKKITTIREKDGETFIPIVILKFGKYDHLISLLNEGTIFINSINEIRKIEDKENFRNDPLEGVKEYTSVGPTDITIVPQSGKPARKVPVLNITYYGQYEEVYGNICSFYGITDKCFVNDVFTTVDERMKLFGPYFIVIKNFDEFINRIDKAVEMTTKTSWEYGFVKYFNEKQFAEKMNIFKKRSIYTYQKEFRLHFRTGHSKPISVKIGSLTDIASVYPIEALNKFDIRLDWEKRQAQISFR